MKGSPWLAMALVVGAIGATALAASASPRAPSKVVLETTFPRSIDSQTDGRGNRFVAYVTGTGPAAHVAVVKLNSLQQPVDTWIVAAPGARADACSIMSRDGRAAHPGVTKLDLEVFVSYHTPDGSSGWSVATIPDVFEPRPF